MMESSASFILLLALSILLPSFLLRLLSFYKLKSSLNSGPPAIPVLGNFLWLYRPFNRIEPLLQDLSRQYGPIVTLFIGSRPAIFISARSIAHKALVESDASFSDRPAPVPATRFLSSNQHISSAPYGPLWRLLRRNLMSEILHPSKIKIYADDRDWVLGVLISHLSQSSGSVVAKQSFQFAMFCLLVLMAYGEKLDEKGIREIEESQRRLLLYSRNLNVFAFVPSISKYVFRGRWKTAVEMRKRQTELILLLIKARREHKKMMPSKLALKEVPQLFN